MSIGALFSLPNVFDPLTVAGCGCFLRSDLGVTLSGSIVTQWNDQSGNGRNATPVGSPTQVANVQNGFPSIRFNGTNQYFTLPSQVSNGGHVTVFAVFKFSTVGSTTQGFYTEFAGNQFRLIYLKNGGWAYDGYNGQNAGSLSSTTGISTATCYVLSGSDGNNTSVQLNVNADAGVSAGGADLGGWAGSTARIGATTSTTQVLAGDLMAMAVYNNVVSEANRIYLRDGFKTLYAAY